MCVALSMFLPHDAVGWSGIVAFPGQTHLDDFIAVILLYSQCQKKYLQVSPIFERKIPNFKSVK